MCSFFFPVVFFNSLGSEQTKIYRVKILLCCGAIRVDTKFEIRMSTFFLGGRTGQIILGDRAVGCYPSWLKSAAPSPGLLFALIKLFR